MVKCVVMGIGVGGGGLVVGLILISVQLSDKRRVTVSLYAGKHMINIREYYEKDGDFLPGKKVKFSCFNL